MITIFGSVVAIHYSSVRAARFAAETHGAGLPLQVFSPSLWSDRPGRASHHPSPLPCEALGSEISNLKFEISDLKRPLTLTRSPEYRGEGKSLRLSHDPCVAMYWYSN